MKLLKKDFKIAKDLLFTISSNLVMQVALHLIIYPLITRFYGEDTTGDILYFIGIVYIIPQAVGTSLNNVRLTTRKIKDTSNGDYAGILVSMSALTGTVCFLIGYISSDKPFFSILFALFSIIYAIRMYAQVEFRLKLDFRGYFIYYTIVSIGYLIGFIFYILTGTWIVIFLTGELMAIGYSLWKGNIFKAELPTGQTRFLYKTIIMILLSILIRDGITQFDKVILRVMISAESVTYYNALSLIGKSAQMLINPVNTLILTYLSAKDSKLGRTFFKKFLLCCFGVGGILLLFCQVATPVYIRLFYNNFYEKVISYGFLVNGGLIVGFISMFFTALILSQGKTKLYMTIQIIWGLCYLIPLYFFIKNYGIIGLAWITLIANCIKLFVSLVISRNLIVNCEERRIFDNRR